MSDTKVGPAITSANLPAPPVVVQPEVTHVADADIIARPLTDPDFTKMTPKNPQHSLRWVNRVHGNSGRGGRFDEAKASGFRPALLADVKEEVPSTMRKDGSIICGDLILMLMDRVSYVGALKYNEQQAKNRLRTATMGIGTKELSKALNEVTGSAEDKAKVQLYKPSR